MVLMKEEKRLNRMKSSHSQVLKHYLVTACWIRCAHPVWDGCLLSHWKQCTCKNLHDAKSHGTALILGNTAAVISQTVTRKSHNSSGQSTWHAQLCLNKTLYLWKSLGGLFPFIYFPASFPHNTAEVIGGLSHSLRGDWVFRQLRWNRWDVREVNRV